MRCSPEANPCVSPFKSLQSSEHLAFANTLTLQLRAQERKLNTPDLLCLLVSSPWHTASRHVGPSEIPTDPQTLMCLRTLRAVCKTCTFQGCSSGEPPSRGPGATAEHWNLSIFKVLHMMPMQVAHGKHSGKYWIIGWHFHLGCPSLTLQHLTQSVP